MKHNWEYKPFKQLSNILYGCPFESEFFNSEANGMPLIRIRDVKPGYTSTYFSGSYSDEFLITKGDYLIGMDGEFNIAPWKGENALLNQRVCRVKSKDGDQILTDFIYYFLGKKLKDIESITSFVTVKHLSAKVLNSIETPVPPMEVQEQIVAELDAINGLIEKNREVLRNLDALAQSIFYDTFGDPITNPKGWPLYKLKDAMIEMFLGPFGSALKTDCYVPEKDSYAMVYEQKHAIKKTLNQENHFIDEGKFNALRRFEVLSGDFLMSCRGTIGQLYQVPANSPRGIIHPSVMKIRLKKDIYSPKYFNFFLPLIIANENTKGNCVQMAITAKELGAKILPVPPLALQESFATQIEAIEAQKSKVEAAIAELQTLLDSRMDYWFN